MHTMLLEIQPRQQVAGTAPRFGEALPENPVVGSSCARRRARDAILRRS
jgi:hypothetical protein